MLVRREEIDVNTPFEELSKADQDFVINGEKRADEYTDEDYENNRWDGSAVSFAGSNRRLTRCTCASCSVDTALM